MLRFDTKTVSQEEVDRMIAEAARLKRLSTSSLSGWVEFVNLLDLYCENMLQYKKNFNLSTATPDQLNILKLHDRDVWLIQNFIKKIPANFVNGLEKAIEEQRKIEAEKNKPQEAIDD